MDAPTLSDSPKVRKRTAANGDESSRSIKDALVEKLTAEGFCITEVTGSASGAGRDFSVSGALSEFVACARQLEIKVLFIRSEALDDDDFYYGVEPIRGAPLDDDERFDLREVVPKLENFERYIDAPRLVVATGCFGGHSISYSEEAQWVAGFAELRNQAVEKIIASSEDEEEQREREQEEREEQLVALIRELRNNPDFRAIFASTRPTQGGIIAYIRTKIEGSEELPNSILRREANLLRDSVLLAKQ